MSTRVFASPLFVGFDQLEQMLERASKSTADGYPPYNIEQLTHTTLRITLAVAGFTINWSSAVASPRRPRAGCSCIAASPPGSSSAPSSWPRELR